MPGVVRTVVLGLLIAGLGASPARADWTTYHADPGRSGLDRSGGAPGQFGAAWSAPLAGKVEAEPLAYQGLVIVATESNDLYGLDAASGHVVWHANAGPAVPAGNLPCGSISPTVGITSTPVIDPANGELLAVADLLDAGNRAHHTLIAYNARTGAELFRRNVDPPGATPENQLQRAALNVSSGNVLIGYGGNDGDCASYLGYLVSTSEAAASTAVNVWKAPSSNGDAIWGTGGVAVDGAQDAFAATGNGFDTKAFDHGESLVKYDSSARELDYFAPSSWSSDNANDLDLGSVAPELLPGGLAFQGGKNGNGYLLDTTHLGGIGGQVFSAPVCASFGADAFAGQTIYVACADGIRALSVDTTNRRFTSLWHGPANANGPPIIAGGLVWVTAFNNSRLYGLDPQTGAVRVNQSTPSMVHFTSPTADNGRLFLATDATVEAYTIGASTPGTPVGVGAPAPPSGPAPTTVNPPSRSGCGRLSFRLDRARQTRIVRVAVYLGHRRLTRRHGRRLLKASIIAPRAGSFSLRVVETTRLGHRFTVTVRFRNCHQVVAHSRRRRHR